MKHKVIRLYDIHDLVEVVDKKHKHEFFRWIGDHCGADSNGSLIHTDLVELYDFELNEHGNAPEWALSCLKAIIDALGVDEASDVYIKYWW